MIVEQNWKVAHMCASHIIRRNLLYVIAATGQAEQILQAIAQDERIRVKEGKDMLAEKADQV